MGNNISNQNYSNRNNVNKILNIFINNRRNNNNNNNNNSYNNDSNNPNNNSIKEHCI